MLKIMTNTKLKDLLYKERIAGRDEIIEAHSKGKLYLQPVTITGDLIVSGTVWFFKNVTCKDLILDHPQTTANSIQSLKVKLKAF